MAGLRTAAAVAAAASVLGSVGCTAKGANKAGSDIVDVTVPARAAHTDIIDAYDMLHGAGLRVELPQPVRVTSLAVPGVKLAPMAGSRVPYGSTVKITAGFVAIGSPGVLKSDPHYRVPAFAGDVLSEAVGWADSHHMFWAIPELPALPPSDAPHLFDAYRVVPR